MPQTMQRRIPTQISAVHDEYGVVVYALCDGVIWQWDGVRWAMLPPIPPLEGREAVV